MPKNQLFRPVYGQHFEVRPRHWWNPRQRKAARLAAKLADYHAKEIRAQTSKLLADQIIYGDSYSRPKWDHT